VRFSDGRLCWDCPSDGEDGARCYQCPLRKQGDKSQMESREMFEGEKGREPDGEACTACGAVGYTSNIGCCGNGLPSGECCGNGVEVQDPCEHCQTSGYEPVVTEDELLAKLKDELDGPVPIYRDKSF
jgi:hypothetical protein